MDTYIVTSNYMMDITTPDHLDVTITEAQAKLKDSLLENDLNLLEVNANMKAWALLINAWL